MRPMQRLTVALLIACGLAACNRKGPELPTEVKDPVEENTGREGVDTVTVDPNGAFVGAAVDGNGEIATPQREFKAGDTVYISVPSKGRKMGSQVEVFWFHDDGKSRKDEAKRIEGPFTVFEFKPVDAGKYNTEVDVNGRPIALVEFAVQ